MPGSMPLYIHKANIQIEIRSFTSSGFKKRSAESDRFLIAIQ